MYVGMQEDKLSVSFKQWEVLRDEVATTTKASHDRPNKCSFFDTYLDPLASANGISGEHGTHSA